ncbi:MAG: methyltransferase domain-containing protein [Thermoguttaceae bacterium]|jgi:SAM-dependent methyltransferase
MPNAFARAMLDQVQASDREVYYYMRRAGWLGWIKLSFPCRDFVEVRPEERELLGDLLRDRETPRVLDIGCGIGRHLSYLKLAKPSAELTGVEHNEVLSDHCRRTIPSGRFLRTLDDVPAGEKFDLILLMGNGLGIFGTKPGTRQALGRLFELLAEGGVLLVEAGNRYSRGFKAMRLVIEYEGESDGPFWWGYASMRWLQRELEPIGYRVRAMRPSNIGAEFFFCVAERPAV